MAPPVGYIAYIDEAGDAGIKNIRTKTARGASEWLVMSAVLVRAERQAEVNGWVRQMLASLDQPQARQLHFRNIPLQKRKSIVRQLATLNVRLFVFLSHKKNMEGYRNLSAEQSGVNETAWFHVWCTKVLMESVTNYCGRRSRTEQGEPRTVRCEFSATGGLKLADLRTYYRYIKDQAKMGISFNKDFPLDWEVVDPEEMFIYPNSERYGLQLADVLASAFYAGLEYPNSGQLNPEYAKLLLPRICPERNHKRFMYGVKVLPRWIGLRLPAEQRAILDFYEDK